MTQHKRQSLQIDIFSTLYQWRGYFLFFCLFLFALRAFAQPAGADQDMFTYRVQPNDTLSELSELYTRNTYNWPYLQSLNDIDDPKRLPIGKNLLIPFSLIPVQPTTAELIHVQGQVLLNDQPASVHSTIQTGDRLQTGHNSFATISLKDQSTLTLPENSRILFQQINEFQGTPISDVIFVLEEGTLETNADPEQRGVGRYEIHTPISVTGVRGTKMRVRANEQSTRTELVEGRAFMQGLQLAPQIIKPRHGAALDASGEFYVASLLEAPHIIDSDQTKGGLKVSLQPMDAATHYVAIVTADPEGQQIIGQQESTEPFFDLPVYRAGTHYAFIRAVDTHGFMGLDTVIDYPGHRVLLDGSGQPVRTRFGQAVLSGLP